MELFLAGLQEWGSEIRRKLAHSFAYTNPSPEKPTSGRGNVGPSLGRCSAYSERAST